MECRFPTHGVAARTPNRPFLNFGIRRNIKMNIENDFRNRLNKEFYAESDRGCAILTVCLLEETLMGIFAKVLPEGKDEARQFVPFGRLSLGINNAAALGLITEPEITNIKIILKIRNTFAHKLLDGLTFETPEIKDQVMRLTLPNLVYVSEKTRNKTMNISRTRYMEVFSYTVAALERVAIIATPYPAYKSLPAFSIEI